MFSCLKKKLSLIFIFVQLQTTRFLFSVAESEGTSIEEFSSVMRKSFSAIGCNQYSSSCHHCSKYRECRYCLMKPLETDEELLFEIGVQGHVQPVSKCVNITKSNWNDPVQISEDSDATGAANATALVRYGDCGILAPDFNSQLTCDELEDLIEEYVMSFTTTEAETDEESVALESEVDRATHASTPIRPMTDAEVPFTLEEGNVEQANTIFLVVVVPAVLILTTTLLSAVLVYCGLKGIYGKFWKWLNQLNQKVASVPIANESNNLLKNSPMPPSDTAALPGPCCFNHSSDKCPYASTAFLHTSELSTAASTLARTADPLLLLNMVQQRPSNRTHDEQAHEGRRDYIISSRNSVPRVASFYQLTIDQEYLKASKPTDAGRSRCDPPDTYGLPDAGPTTSYSSILIPPTTETLDEKEILISALKSTPKQEEKE